MAGVEGTLANRVSDYFYAEVAANNGIEVAPQAVEVLAGQAGLGASGEDVYHRETRTAYAAPVSEGYSHDGDGNLTNDARWDYVYDAENRLVQMQTRAAAVTNGVLNEKLVFRYDELHRRVEKVHYSGPALTLQYTRRFIYNGWNMIAEMDTVGSVGRTYMWGLDISGTVQEAGGVRGLLMVSDGGSEYLPAYDSLGNIHALVVAQSGALDAIYEYSPFGELLRSSGIYADANPFGLSTKYTDRESDLVYYGRRYYNADTGRFINRDPIEQEGGLNLYAFVSNNAINLWDYLGMRRAFDVRFGGRDQLTPTLFARSGGGLVKDMADVLEEETFMAKTSDPSKNFSENTVYKTEEDKKTIEVTTDELEEFEGTSTNTKSIVEPSTSNETQEVTTQQPEGKESDGETGDGKTKKQLRKEKRQKKIRARQLGRVRSAFTEVAKDPKGKEYIEAMKKAGVTIRVMDRRFQPIEFKETGNIGVKDFGGAYAYENKVVIIVIGGNSNTDIKSLIIHEGDHVFQVEENGIEVSPEIKPQLELLAIEAESAYLERSKTTKGQRYKFIQKFIDSNGKIEKEKLLNRNIKDGYGAPSQRIYETTDQIQEVNPNKFELKDVFP